MVERFVMEKGRKGADRDLNQIIFFSLVSRGRGLKAVSEGSRRGLWRRKARASNLQ